MNFVKCSELKLSLTLYNLILILLFYLDEIKNKMPNKTYFQKSWLSDSRFVKWIVRSNSKENAHGKLCKCVIGFSNMGEKALYWC